MPFPVWGGLRLALDSGLFRAVGLWAVLGLLWGLLRVVLSHVGCCRAYFELAWGVVLGGSGLASGSLLGVGLCFGV